MAETMSKWSQRVKDNPRNQAACNRTGDDQGPVPSYVNRSTRHLLFLCSRNRLRSPTAEAIFADRDIKTDSAGLSPDAEVLLSPEQIEWADLILVMEKIHLARLNRDYGDYLKDKRVVVLGIPDRYDFMDPSLIAALEKRCAPYIS